MVLLNSKKGTFLLLLSVCMLFSGCQNTNDGWVDDRRNLFGSSADIRIFHEDRSFGEEAVSDAFRRAMEIEMNTMAEKSESHIRRINEAAGTSSVAVTDEVRFLIEEGIRHHQVSNGLYHIGLGHLIRLWGFDNSQPRKPDNNAIRAALESADVESIDLTGGNVMLQKRSMSLHLDQLAKGYALDETAKVLRDQGIQSGIITFGNQVSVLGEKPGGDSWHIWIKAPFISNVALVGYLEVINLSIATVGHDSPYTFEEGADAFYHHIIHPETGALVSNDLASVTVVSDTGVNSHLYATSAFTMGLTEGYRHVLDAPGLEGLFITQDNIIYATPGLAGMFHLIDEEGFTMDLMVIEEEAAE